MCGTVAPAHGGDAVAGAARTRPDLVLIDLGRTNAAPAGAAGEEAAAIEVAQRLAGNGRDLPVVCLTDAVDGERRSRVRRTEPFGYVLKPVDRRQLRLTIEAHRMEAVVLRLRSDTDGGLCVTG